MRIELGGLIALIWILNALKVFQNLKFLWSPPPPTSSPPPCCLCDARSSPYVCKIYFHAEVTEMCFLSHTAHRGVAWRHIGRLSPSSVKRNCRSVVSSVSQPLSSQGELETLTGCSLTCSLFLLPVSSFFRLLKERSGCLCTVESSLLNFSDCFTSYVKLSGSNGDIKSKLKSCSQFS